MDMKVALMKFTINKGIVSAVKRNKGYMDQHKQRKRELGSILLKLSNIRDLFVSTRLAEMAIPEGLTRQPSILSDAPTSSFTLQKRRTLRQIFNPEDDDELRKALKKF